MSGFQVDVSLTAQEADKFSKQKAELKNLADAVLRIQKNLTVSCSQEDKITRSLNGIETNILEEAVQMENLSKALIYIGKTYEKVEKRVSAQGAENYSVIARIGDKIHDGLIRVLDILGLDDEYYRRVMNLENFDRQRTQERLMDEYLQYSANSLLNTERFSEVTWNNASVEERKAILNEFLEKLNYMMGTNVKGSVLIDGTLRGTGKRGYYSYPADTVTVNPDYLDGKRTDSYMIMSTMIHEMRHAYQYTAVDNPEAFLVSKETRKQWAENFRNYKTVDRDGWEKYVSQAIEYDAKNFAQQYQDIYGVTPVYSGSWD